MIGKQSAGGAENTTGRSGKELTKTTYPYADSTTRAAVAQRPAHGRISGAVWRKTLRKSLHLLRLPAPAWCVDVADLQAAVKCGAVTLRIVDSEERLTYTVAIDHFLAHAQVFDRGHGRQAALPLGFWQVKGKTTKKKPAGPVQLAMFREASL